MEEKMSGKDVSRENYDFKENYFIKFSQIHFGYYDILKILFSHLLRFPAAAIPMPRRTAAPTASKNPAKATDTLPPESMEKPHSMTLNWRWLRSTFSR